MVEVPKSDKLMDCRNRIDAIDREIVKLLAERFDIAKDIAEYKQKNNLPVFQSGREAEVLRRIAERAGAEYEKYAVHLYKNIMDMSKLLQRFSVSMSDTENDQDFKNLILRSCVDLNKKDDNTISSKLIGCQGTEGAYSEKAANMLYSGNRKIFFDNFSDVFDAVNDGKVDIGVIPIENSNAGSVKTIHALLQKSEFYIAASVIVPVSHCLLAKNDNSLTFDDITDIYSHEQAFLQCGEFFAKNKHITKHIYKNTAMAAKYVYESNNRHIAAIGSEDCAELYNLKILQREVQDYKNNSTRFICISKELKIFNDSNKFTVVLKLPHKHGSLSALLSKFAALNINLTKIESQPIAGSDFEFMFFIDGEGNVKNPELVELLCAIRSEVEYFKFLGNY